MAQRGLAVALGTVIGLAVAVAGAFVACTGRQLDHGFVDRGAQERRREILGELAAGPSPVWAGSYRWSNGYEHHALELAPSGFWYQYSHCTGIGHVAYGAVEEMDDAKVRLDVARSLAGADGDRSVLAGAGGELVSIPWGERRFLVPMERMPEFCSTAAARGGLGYATFLHLVRPGESSVHGNPKLEGLPAVPDEFRGLLPE